jgi:hypothetical protein
MTQAMYTHVNNLKKRKRKKSKEKNWKKKKNEETGTNEYRCSF